MAIGKGLGALITSTNGARKKHIYKTESKNETNTEKVWLIPVSEIEPSKGQPRKDFPQGALQEMAESIKEHGVLQPLLVSEKLDGSYELIAGERRWRAAKMAGLATVPALVKEFAEQQKLEVALIENIQRQDLNPIEEAFAYKRLIDEFGLTQKQAAEKLGKSRPVVANTIRLLDLPAHMQQALIENKIGYGQARALLSITDLSKQEEAFQSTQGKKITSRDLERIGARQNAGKKGARQRDPNIMYMEDQLRHTLNTKVNISGAGKRGTITIDYYSPDELASIIKKILP
jgi:ParB family transcriptional regulator, chromosome partitioning protein